MSRCEEIRDDLAAFIAGEPAEDSWDGVRSHIGGCTPCADACAGLRRTWAGLSELKFEEVPRGALDRLQERVREASRAERRARGVSPWLLGLADGALGMIALYLITRVIPVSIFCRLCRDVFAGTRFQGWVYTGEFTAGSVLSAASILLALIVGRTAWQLMPGQGERGGHLAIAGFSYALLAIVLGPNHVVVGNSTAFTAWGSGAALGTLGAVVAMALYDRWLPAPHAS